MEPLDVVLTKITKLKRDLSALRIVQQEEGHYERVGHDLHGGPGDEGRNIQFL